MTSLNTDDPYLTYYRLSHDPFAARVPGFKFFPVQRKPVLGQLHHLARYSSLLLLVTGPRGSGKTLLRQALIASTNKETVQSEVISGKEVVDARRLLELIAKGLKSNQPEPQAILERVRDLERFEQEFYLLVDDAERLDDSSLHALLALSANDNSQRLHIFLFGESSLVSRLETLSGGEVEEQYHVIELESYSREEMLEYLSLRLEGAGQSLQLFNQEQLDEIYDLSGGWPGRINETARDLLVEGMLSAKPASKQRSVLDMIPRKHLTALALVGLCIILVWAFTSKEATQGTVSQPVAAQPPSGSATTAGQNSSGQLQPPSIAFNGSSSTVPLELPGNESSEAQPLQPVDSQPVVRQPLAGAAGEVDDNVEPPVIDQQRGTPLGTQTDPVSIPAPAQVPPATQTPPAVNTQPPVAQPQTSRQPVQQTKPPVTTAKPPVQQTKPPVTPPGATNNSGADSWHRAQPAGNFTIQISASSTEASAQRFVREQGGDYRYFKKVTSGKAAYVITYGNFSSRAAAQTALQKLPPKVKASKPWIRNFGSIQREIR